jgi:hypothetical protein
VRRSASVALPALFGLIMFALGAFSHAARSQDSMLPGAASIVSLTLTGQITTNGTTRTTLVAASGTLVPCFEGGVTNSNTSTAHTLIIRAMPRGVVVRYVYFPSGTNAHYDSVGVVHGDGGGSLTIEAESGSGADIVVAGDASYRQAGN